MRRPAWAGAPGFVAAWAGTEQLAQYRTAPDAWMREWAAIACSALERLQHCHVIVVEREQVAALPLLADPQTGAISTDAVGVELAALRLPFDPIFIDISKTKQRPARDEAVGALLWSDGDAVCGVPFSGKRGLARPFPILARGRAGGMEWDERAQSFGGTGWEGHEDPEFRAFIAREAGRLGVAEKAVVMFGALAMEIERSVAVMRWLESVNVDVVSPSVPDKQRAREAKKGRRMALVVQVRQSRRYLSTQATGSRANYSHRFETRGHYKHVTRGPVFDATPLDRRSYVPGVGECRKVWCPPFVKGPADKPLIPKIREVVAD